MKLKANALYAILPMVGMIASCGAVKDEATEIRNDAKIKGHWLMTESEHSNQVEKVLENESMVLTFKDDKAAFSPTDSVKGQTVYALLSKCTKEVRPYKTDKNQVVFVAVPECPERRVTVEKLDDTTLKFPDPDNGDITRTFQKIDDERYFNLVKASDRKP